MLDEGPSAEDRARFGGDTAYCPECGQELWDQADFCPSCGYAMTRGPSGRSPVESTFRRKWVVVVVILILVAFFFTFVL